MLILSFPVFRNFYNGQVNLWLIICSGEFMRALFSEKPLKAGAWLGGWLLKPQLLILILPFLLFRRKFKVLVGFGLSAFAIGLTSFILVGVEGLLGLKDILLGSASGGTASNPPVMMNWRMLGWHINTFNSTTIGLVIAVIGIVLTISTTLIIFSRGGKTNNSHNTTALLGILAATGTVAWHAHIHMSLILIPPMLYLILQDRFDQNLFSLWTFAPILLIFIAFIVTALFQLDIQLIQFIEGGSGFVFNLAFLGWAMISFRKGKMTFWENDEL